MLEIERSLSSNMCRCTGYRPILEAFRKFASDAPDQIKLSDIEELHLCTKTSDVCSETCNEREWCLVTKDALEESIICMKLKDGREWFRVLTVADIFKVLREKGTDSYMLVAGNTGKGVIPKIEYPQNLIDISGVSELRGHLIDQNLVIRAGTTLTNFIEILKEISDTENFEFLSQLIDHLGWVAHLAVRNLGTIAGNLMLKHQDNKISSDIFLLLLAVGAQLTLVLAPGVTKVVGLENFLAESMIGKLILNILIPPLTRENRLVTYKVAARSRNAHAMVNAAFLLKFNKSDNIVQSCRIVYGGLSPKFNRARKTEKNLVGKNLFSNDTLQMAVRILSNELVVVENPPEPSAEYRKQVALGLFYKVQCAGESKYAEDLNSLPREVFAAFVLSTVALGTIDSIDASEALKQPGVVAFYTAKDIPGVNSFTTTRLPFIAANEEILCSGNVLYYNQPIGIVVAESNYIANRAALMVKVEYSNVRKPETDVRTNKNNPDKAKLYRSIDATDRGNNVIKVIKGDYTMYGQSYFCTENLNCTSRPTEEGLKLRPSSHYLNSDQFLTAQCLNIEHSRVDVKARRLGGNLEAMGTAEMILERITYELGLDPLTVRLNNIDAEYYDDLKEMFDTLKKKSDYIERRSAVDKFNDENRWRKRGLRFTCMKWFGSIPFIMNVILSVYHGDGSVAIIHGGVDLGQGIHTKATQVCAYFLKIPIDKIHVKASNTKANPNNYFTSASLTSQNTALGVRKCCEELLKRLEPVRAQMNNPTWEELIAEAYRLGVNLQTNSYVGFDDLIEYNVYGVALAEVEIDILTGQWEILRTDLLEDGGRIVSPFIDVGQVEGAFVMGIGYWTTEELVYDTTTGELLTDRTWNYYVPQGTDIPQDLRVYFRDKPNSDIILGSKDGPYTVEKICLACKTKIEDFKFY
nr:indole-3-acetaldehyde oxidase-like [Maniola hyperantus]